jgi:hypothetical protein
MDSNREHMIRNELRKLPQERPPASLRTALCVIASRERQTLLDTRGSRWQRFWQVWKPRLNELVSPFTIPATGGFFSSCVLFALLALTIGRTTQVVAYEVPVMYADRADANLVPVELRSSVIVTLSLDGKGRITDYGWREDGSDSFVGDAAHLQGPNIPIPEFPSVLALAQPISSDISIRFTPLLFRQ